MDKSDLLPETRYVMTRLRKHTVLSLLLAAAGVVLTVALGYATDEPNAVTPSMAVIGLVWFVATRVRLRSLRRASGPEAGARQSGVHPAG